MKPKFVITAIILALLIGLTLVLYPSVSDFINDRLRTRDISLYTMDVDDMDEADYQSIWDAAEEFNQFLAKRNANSLRLTKSQKETYRSLMNVSGTGVMAYIEIPSIRVFLPIYHGTDENILQIAVGHVEGSSLPIGGESTHCVLSGHRGLPSARLFTDLDKLKEGDIFKIKVMHETLTYEVDRITTVEPEEVDKITVTPGEDYCTLVTCTPYGVNTHRLLVRGHRVATSEDELKNAGKPDRTLSEISWQEVLIMLPVVGIPILLIVLILMVVFAHRKKKKERQNS